MKTFNHASLSFLILATILALCGSLSCGQRRNAARDRVSKTYPDSLSKIVGILVKEYDADWYHRQFDGWREQTRQDPKDEYAWLNGFNALNYELMFSHQDYSAVDSIKLSFLEEMHRDIPDTYTYYYSAYKSTSSREEEYDYGWKAFHLIPEQKDFNDYDCWYAFLKRVGDKQYYPAFSKEYYSSGIYPEELFISNMNELNCMDEGSIYVGLGDARVIPKWLIQDAIGKHNDKLVLCYDFFYDEDYCQRLYDELGIGDVPEMKEAFIRLIEQGCDIQRAPYEMYVQYVINEVSVRTGRKLFLGKYAGRSFYAMWDRMGSLYDFGLSYVISSGEPEDWINELGRRLWQCDFQYLNQPLDEDSWRAVSLDSFNLSVNLMWLLWEYKDTDNSLYNKLYSIVEKAVNRIYDESLRESGLRYLSSLDIE